MYHDYQRHVWSGDPKAGDLLRRLDGRKLGDVIPIDEGNLPRPDWDLFDLGFTDRVQLYDLKNDPYETTNLAGGRRDLVDDMVKAMVEIVSNR